MQGGFSKLLFALGLVIATAAPAVAGPLTLGWTPVVGATGYDVEQSIDNGVTWTVVVPTVAVACVGTPVACTATVSTPATGRPQYIVTSKNAGGRTRPQIGIVATDVVMNPIAPPPATDAKPVEGGR